MIEILRILAFPIGLAIVLRTISSAIRTFVLPRSVNDALTRFVFRTSRSIFNLIMKPLKTFQQRDSVLAFYAPITLIMLPAVWLVLVLIGYMFMYWACGVDTMRGLFTLSGSSLMTLGFATVADWPTTILAFSEASIGLVLTALLIAYLPTMYSAFQRREQFVTLLEVRAGNPPSPMEMLVRAHRITGLERLNSFFGEWEVWFTDLEESHTSLPAINFFRSPQPHRAWVVAAGTVLDAAALRASTIDLPRNPETELCIRAGFLAMRRIADYFMIKYNPNPQYGDPIRLSKEQFEAAYDTMKAAGVPVKPDRDQCWRDFAGWRVNYEAVLYILAGITMAPGAPWLPEQPWQLVRVVRPQRKKK